MKSAHLRGCETRPLNYRGGVINTSSKNSSKLLRIQHLTDTQHTRISNRISKKCSNNVIKRHKSISPRLWPAGAKHWGLRKGKGHTTNGNTMHTKKTFAELLQISVSTVNRLINNGEIRPLRIGKSVRITDAEVHRFICESQVR